MPPAGYLSGFLHKATMLAPGFYRVFLVHVAMPKIALFAQLVGCGELLVGLSLALGLLTRAGAIGGMFLMLNYLLAQGELNGAEGYVSLETSPCSSSASPTLYYPQGSCSESTVSYAGCGRAESHRRLPSRNRNAT